MSSPRSNDSGSSRSSSSGRTSMTKEQLKAALIQNRVPLPPTSAKKEIFQKLYDENVPQGNGGGRGDFSSDDENEVADVEIAPIRIPPNSREEIDTYSDLQIYHMCIGVFGKSRVGPVLDNTRALYKKKLLDYFFPIGVNQANGGDLHANGSVNDNNDGYSDSDSDTDEISDLAPASVGATIKTARIIAGVKCISMSKYNDGTRQPQPTPPLVDTNHTRPVRRSVTPYYAGTNQASTSTAGQKSRTSGGLTVESRTEKIQTGVSYFQERPGFPSASSSNQLRPKPLPKKAMTRSQESEPKELKLEGNRRRLIDIIGLMVSVVLVVFFAYWFKDWLIALTSYNGGGGDSSELDKALEELEEFNNKQ